MGLSYILEDENRTSLREIGDPTGILTGLLERAYDGRLHLLSGIDRYGDTVFNRRQMAQLLEEWKSLLRWATSDDETSLILEIIALCHECQSNIHTYLRIEGD